MISQECIDFLKKSGCDKKSHSTKLKGDDYTLLDHLIATSEILEKNGAAQHIQDAGLFHSIYGTAFFMPGGGMVSFDDRDTIKDLIGKKAEEIAYTFCMLDSPRHQSISNMEDGGLKEDLLFLNIWHDELYAPKEMTWEEAYNL